LLIDFIEIAVIYLVEFSPMQQCDCVRGDLRNLVQHNDVMFTLSALFKG